MKDIYERIKEDHDSHRRLLDLLDKTHGDSDGRRELFNRLKTEVAGHTAAEEETFYASLIATPEGREQARHSVSEHKEAADLIDELAEMDFSSSGWLTRFRSLKKSLEHHMDEEEDEVFARARTLISGTEAAALGKTFARRKSAEKKAA